MGFVNIFGGGIQNCVSEAEFAFFSKAGLAPQMQKQ